MHLAAAAVESVAGGKYTSMMVLVVIVVMLDMALYIAVEEV